MKRIESPRNIAQWTLNVPRLSPNGPSVGRHWGRTMGSVIIGARGQLKQALLLNVT